MKTERYPLSKQQAFDTPGDAFLAYYASIDGPDQRRKAYRRSQEFYGRPFDFFCKLLFHLRETNQKFSSIDK
jgi:hypothetical protein